MRLERLALTWVLVSCAVLGCSSTLRKENAHLEEEIAAMKRSAASHKDEKVRDVFLTELGAARHAASFDLKEGGLTSDEACGADPAVQAYVEAKTRWIVMRRLLGAQRMILDCRLPALVEFVMGDPEKIVAEFRPLELVDKKFVLTLLDYYRMSVDETSSGEGDEYARGTDRFDRLTALQEEQGQSYPLYWGMTLESFREVGFSPHPNHCLQEAAYFDFNRTFDETTSIYFADFQPAEFWYYSFWYRRYREGTMELTRRLLEAI